MKTSQLLEKLGLSAENAGGFNGTWLGSGDVQAVHSPIDGELIARVNTVTALELERIMAACHDAFQEWRYVPAPKRGEIVKAIGYEISVHREVLAELITLEMGKCYREALGEIQEMIDVFDFAVGLSRQLYGLTMPSERPHHRLQEQWHPLGMAAVISAFNFPAAVWSWNAGLGLVCGNSILWKPSSKTPLTAIACTRIAAQVLARHGQQPALCSLVIGPGNVIGDRITTDRRSALVSYTGSVRRGREVGKLVQGRFGRHILELGGNGAVIVSESADLDIALRAIYFGAIGTAGQRCTSTRRVIAHESVYDELVTRLKSIYAITTIGDPRDDTSLMGPLVDTQAVEQMMKAKAAVQAQGGKILIGGERLWLPGGCYVTPCLAEAGNDLPIVKEETFAPILYLMKYSEFDDAIAMHNDVPQGLSSAIITNDMREAEIFMSAGGSDCGIANVNTGTSGAEIGGAFGGEKETGGGRESGSDAWKAYMRRQTSTINFSGGIVLAQDIKFDI